MQIPECIRTALIVAPHPDDETIGAWGLMARLRQQGVRIRVLVVSDGAASHPGSLSWPPSRLVAARRGETRRAMRGLGIPAAAIRFAGLPDGGLDSCGLERALTRAIRTMPPADLVVGPVEDDDHGDHRAVARAVRRCRFGSRPRLSLGYRVWPLDRRKVGPMRVLLRGAGRHAKRRAVLSYRTQAGAITDSPTGMMITHRHLAAFARPFEHFRVLA